MSAYPRVLEQLIAELEKLPGVGNKTAERLAFHLLKSEREEALGLARAITDLKDLVRRCSECCNLADSDPCRICADASRDPGLLCVVEEPKDVLAFEKTGRFRGRYHVLLGRIAPLEGQEPDALTLQRLEARVASGGVREVILATNPDLEGDATALHVARLLAERGVKVTRIAKGIPTGSHIEYTSTAILADALAGRRELAETVTP